MSGGKFWPARPLATAVRNGLPSPFTPRPSPRRSCFSKPWKFFRCIFQASEKSSPTFSNAWKISDLNFQSLEKRSHRSGPLRSPLSCGGRTAGAKATPEPATEPVMSLARHCTSFRYGATGLRRLRLDGREFYATRRHGYAAALQPCGWLHRIKSSSANSAVPRRPSARLPLRSRLIPLRLSSPGTGASDGLRLWPRRPDSLRGRDSPTTARLRPSRTARCAALRLAGHRRCALRAPLRQPAPPKRPTPADSARGLARCRVAKHYTTARTAQTTPGYPLSAAES